MAEGRLTLPFHGFLSPRRHAIVYTSGLNPGANNVLLSQPIVISIKTQTENARNFSKVSQANKLFTKTSRYGGTLTQRLQRHVNGSLREPFRKFEKFVEHNSAKELAQVASLSEHALFLREVTGRDYEMSHLHPLCRASEVRKVNNVNNLIVLLRETNQIIAKRSISRANAEVLDRMVYSGNHRAAREFAERACF